jgi:Tfp pilus tip-associated adhesin PilY1
MILTNFSRSVLTALAVVLGLGGVALQQASAAAIDLSPTPVAGTGQASPKPNVMLLMDTSKSMSYTHMPDELETTAFYTQSIGYRSAQCNSLYYDPTRKYSVPKDASQLDFATPSFYGARYNYYSLIDTSTVDLSAKFRAYDVNTLAVAIKNTREDTEQPAYYYVYTGGGTPLSYKTAPCTDQESVIFPAGAPFTGTVSGNTTFTTSSGTAVTGVWKRVRVSSVSGTGPAGADETVNFAIWYTYYRTRMAMVKSSVSTAFAPLTDKFRIGFVTVNPLLDPTSAASGVNPASYLSIFDFNSTQKSAWYSKIYSQEPNGSSPAREGLARVGRHYAGKADGINKNMTPDPVTNSCQQNFTIMTTDGYWNTAQETAGPVGIDGINKVGNMDGVLTPQASLDRTDHSQYAHRPMWDGSTSGTRTDTNRFEMMQYQPCDSGQYYKTTSIIRQSTSQTLQRTQSLTKSTSQLSMSTQQTSKSTTQLQKTTASATKQTLQTLASTQQQTRSTRQELQTTTSYGQGTATILGSYKQVLQSTSYTEKEQTTRQSQTTQTIEADSRLLQSTSQTTKTTLQYKVATSQPIRTQTSYQQTSQTTAKSTSQTFQSTRREIERTSQLVAYNGATEQAVPVASCTASSTISCLTLVSGPTSVVSCTPQTAASGNNYLARTCDPAVTTGPTAVQSCATTAASSGNGFTSTSCSTPAPTTTNVASCSAPAPSAANSWTTTTCTPGAATTTTVASCTAGASGVNMITCSAPSVASVPVQTCTASTTSTLATTCSSTTNGPTAIASCANISPTLGNNWVTTTCTSTPTTTVGVQTCTGAAADSTNSYIATTCTIVPTGPTQVATCAGSVASTSNSWKSTTCTADPAITSPGAVQTCVAQTASSTNNYITKTCTPVTSAWTANPSCVAISPNGGNSWTTTSCRDFETLVPTPVLPTNCTPGTVGGVTTNCAARSFVDVPVSSCVPNAAGPSFVTCRTALTGPIAVAACTVGAGGSGTNWIITTACSTTTTPNQNVQTCTPVAAGTGNGNVATTCTPSIVTIGVQPGTCATQTGTALNNWVTITCPAASTTGPTPVSLNSCTPVGASSTNAWTATTCQMNGPTVPAGVQTCANGTNATTFVVTTCSTNNSAVQAVAPGSCTAVVAGSGNFWTQTACTSASNTVNVAAGSCVASAAGVLPVVTCNTVSTGPTFVAAGSCSTGIDNNFLSTTCNTVNTGPTLVAACSGGTDANFKVTSCNAVTTGPTALTPGAACTSEAASSANNFVATTCTPSDVSVGVTAGSCTPSAAGVLPVVTCSSPVTVPTPVASCNGGTNGSFLTTTCTPDVTGPDRVTACTAQAPTAANGFTTVTCAGITGVKVQTKTQTTSTTYTVSGTIAIDSTGVAGTTTESAWTDANGGMCYVPPVLPPVIDTSTAWKQSTTGMPSGCTAWPCPGVLDTSSAVAGSVNSLADVAQYYYVTDLRPNSNAIPDPWKDDVPKLGSGIEDDRAPWQHMTTFVLGLGVSGTLNFQADYKSASTGDFTKIRSYTNAPALNWPIWPTSDPLPNSLAYNDPRSIDDFWHTAVNGRGKFFSANDPDSVVQGLKEALAGIEAQAGAGAGAATSNLTPVAGDNTAYTGSFTTSEWTGDLTAQDIDLTTGNLLGTVKWSARTNLDLVVAAQCDNRKIYVKDPASTTPLNFSWNSQGCNALQVPTGAASSDLTPAMRQYFDNTTGSISDTTQGLTQYSLMNTAQRGVVAGANLVNFLRGQRGFEGFVANDVTKLYRTRTHVLGDIVNSQPAYVKAPNLSYQDAGYSAFVTTNAARTPMVYVGANDGMLHAFYAPSKTTDPNYALAGQEAWAFVPTAVMANMYKLADANYADRHIFTVDGAPTAGDVFDTTANAWKSILVGGLNAGGKGYYAIDITAAGAKPKILWEFNFADGCASNPVGVGSDCNVGLTFGRPVITKLKNGKWVVMVTSGYNNISGTGADGKGYLYVLDAMTGKMISRIGTNTGDLTTPSGLKDLNFFVSNAAYDNTALRAYGADILGNVWRFDINDIIAPGGMEATLIGTAKDAANKPQPITTRPELAEVSGNTMVLVATGKLLSIADLTDTSVQTVYAIRDPMTAVSPSYADLRASLKPLVLTQTGSGPSAIRTIACKAGALDCTGVNGWFIDLPDGGERVNVDMQTVLGTLVFATNVPSDTLCVAGGYSWLNYVNLINGEAVATSTNAVVSVPFFQNSVLVGLGLVGLGDGTIRALGRDATGATQTLQVPVGSPPPLGKRISWREITQ